MELSNDVVAWAVLALFILLGILGTFLPFLPGVVLILIGAFVHKMMLPQYLSWWTIGILGLGVVITMLMDLFGSIVGAKWGGATKWGLWGAGVGAIVGIGFFPFGLVIGPLLGAFLGELIAAGRTPKDATKAGLGAGLGIGISVVFRFLIALILTAIVVIDCFV